jgi:hypothetical protein
MSRVPFNISLSDCAGLAKDLPPLEPLWKGSVHHSMFYGKSEFEQNDAILQWSRQGQNMTYRTIWN